MAELKKCRTCGAEVQTNAPFGQCPKCLFELGFDRAPDDSAEFADDPALRAARSALGTVRHFGDYELFEQIGRGGMGVVFKARQKSLNRLVALKMVLNVESASPTVMTRFQLEAEAAAKLEHPNIVSTHDFGELDGQPFFSMRLIEGSNLSKQMPRLSLASLADRTGTTTANKPVLREAQERIARLMATIAGAIHYAHQHGIVHRDLKPTNILIDQQSQPHLTDFGIAKILTGETGLTGTADLLGTPSYMSPEQAAGKPVTRAADIYSLGVILYELLTGRPPFRANTPMETLRRVTEEEPTHPTTLNRQADKELATICLKCLEKDPLRRYSSAEAMAEDLERWLRREPIMARRVGPMGRAWRWCRRNPKVATLGAAVMLLLVTLAVGATVFAFRIKNLNWHLHKQVLASLVKVYEDPGTKFYPIESEVRRALVGEGPARAGAGSVLELTCVEDVYEHPTNMLATLSPILQALEDNLSERLRRPVAIHLHLFKSSATGRQALESTNLTFGRVGPAGYVYLLDRSNGVRLLAMQHHKNPLTMAIFTRTNSEIARLADSRPNVPLADLLANRSLALSGTNSTTGNFMAKWFLATNGIFATNLARYLNHGGQRRVFDAVLTNSFEAGAGNLELVDEYPALRVIAKCAVPGLGRCWIAGKGLDDATEKAFRECLLKLNAPEILEKLESETTGFKRLDETALKRLREIIRGAAAFDTGRSPEPR